MPTIFGMRYPFIDPGCGQPSMECDGTNLADPNYLELVDQTPEGEWLPTEYVNTTELLVLDIKPMGETPGLGRG